ncbi:MAG: hypothetical protein WBD83_19230 [Xanthobacteraceae bacterium]|jgi:hypothetical protein
MATKSSFTTDEWKTVLGSPMLVGMAVTLAEPSGLWGLMKEGMASGRAVMDAKNDAGATELAKAIAAEMEGSEGRGDARGGLRAELTGKTPAELKRQVLAALTRVGQIVDSKAPGEAPAFKSWLTHVAEKVAEASTEGGFMGIGGVQVSAAEKASLTDVARALGTVQ